MNDETGDQSDERKRKFKVQPVPPGKVRYTMVLSIEFRDHIKTLAEIHAVSQPDVMEALLSVADSVPEAKYEEIRSRKEHSMTKNKKLLDVLKRLSPEQIAALEKMAAGA